jgi:hypothetical protein
MTAVQQMIDDLKQMCQIPSSLFDKYLEMEEKQLKDAYFSGWIRANATNFEERHAEQYVKTQRGNENGL